MSGGHQVVMTSHSPEILTRSPSETIRWVDRTQSVAKGGYDVSNMLYELGASPDTYVQYSNLQEVLVYVEGTTDRPLIEAIIAWCRDKSDVQLPSTLVIPHRDGRFESPTLHGIVKLGRTLNANVQVVGIRDLDWYYHETPPEEAILENGDGWAMLTLPCKEVENLYCDPDVLFECCRRHVELSSLRTIVDRASLDSDLMNEWRFQLLPRIRSRLRNGLDDSTKEKMAEEMFEKWAADSEARRRLVADKRLLSMVRKELRETRGVNFYVVRAAEQLPKLSGPMVAIAKAIFPQIDSSVFMD